MTPGHAIKVQRARIREQTRCRVRDCCDRPAPTSRVAAQHVRHEQPAQDDWWSSECWNCGYVCRCDV